MTIFELPINTLGGELATLAEFQGEKIEVNGPDRHPIYAELADAVDAEGHSGDIRWNFEKFLVGPDGSVTRFGPRVEPDDPQLVDAIEPTLAG